jgi:hypothetical protein
MKRCDHTMYKEEKVAIFMQGGQFGSDNKTVQQGIQGYRQTMDGLGVWPGDHCRLKTGTMATRVYRS